MMLQDVIKSMELTPYLDSGCVDLSLRLLPDANGVLLVSITFEDDGGTAFSGENRSDVQFRVQILPVNDRPSFSSSAGIYLNQSHGNRTLRYDGFFRVAAPPVDEQGQASSFAVASQIADGHIQAFAGFNATVSPDGNLTLFLPASLHGHIIMTVTLREDPAQSDGHHAALSSSHNVSAVSSNETLSSVPVNITLDIERVPTVLSFHFAMDFYSAVEAVAASATEHPAAEISGDSDLQANHSLPSSNTEAHSVEIRGVQGTQHPAFVVAHTNAELFRSPPSATCTSGIEGCRLAFELAPGAHGTSTLSVTIETTDRSFTSIPSSRVLVLKVLPRPVIARVSPAFSHLAGGVRVTVHGQHFGSMYSRSYFSAEYHALSITIAGSPCSDVIVLSDAVVSCTAPPGPLGSAWLAVNISDGALSRGAAHRFSYSDLLVAGGRAGSGFLALVSHPVLNVMGLHVNRAVRCAAVWRGEVFVGGSFTYAGGTQVGHVFGYDGSAVYPLGQGVDGVVNAMAVFTLDRSAADGAAAATTTTATTNGGMSDDSVSSHRGGDAHRYTNGYTPVYASLLDESELTRDLVIVGGSFYSAMNQHQYKSPVVKSALAAWDLKAAKWVDISPEPYLGRVDAIVANASVLYVAGTTSLGAYPSSLLSRFDGYAWTTPVGRGRGAGAEELVARGEVAALVMSPGREALFVAGAFHVLDAEVFVARWDGRHFNPIPGVPGRAHAIAFHGPVLFVGGDFGLVAYDEIAGAQRLGARFAAPDGRLLGGHVLALSAAGGCVYVAGALELHPRDGSEGPQAEGSHGPWGEGTRERVRMVRGCAASRRDSTSFSMEVLALRAEPRSESSRAGEENGGAGSAGVVNSDGDARDWRQGIVLVGLEGSASFSERSSELATC